MKKTLKLVIALVLLFSILMQPISVLAIEVIDEIERNTESEDKAPEAEVPPQQEDVQPEEPEEKTTENEKDDIDETLGETTDDNDKEPNPISLQEDTENNRADSKPNIRSRTNTRR